MGDALENPIRPVGYVYEGAEDEPPTHRWRTLVERYVHSEVAFHFTLSKRPLGDSGHVDGGEYGVLLYWPTLPILAMYGGISRERWKIKLIGVQQRARDMESAVLIDIREFFQMPQRTFAALPCATFGYWKGLLRSNQRDGAATNAFEKLCSPASVKPGLGFEDGELVFTAPWGRFTIAQDVKLPDDMVQGRSKIVDDLANTNAPYRIGGSLNVNANGERLRLSVEIDPWNVRCWIGVEKSSQIGLQSIDLIPCL